MEQDRMLQAGNDMMDTQAPGGDRDTVWVRRTVSFTLSLKSHETSTRHCTGDTYKVAKGVDSLVVNMSTQLI